MPERNNPNEITITVWNVNQETWSRFKRYADKEDYRNIGEALTAVLEHMMNLAEKETGSTY